MPAVTIVVPSYNHARFLPECLGSIQRQTFEDWQIALIDDGSTDDSVELARQYARDDSRISVYENEKNLGTYGTEQRGLELTESPFVAIMNSDDLWEPEKLEKQIDSVAAAPEAAFCYTLGRLVDGEGNALPEKEQSILDAPLTPIPVLLEENRILASSVLFRRNGLAFHPDLRYSGDWVALLEATLRGRGVCVSERLTGWRQHDHNTYRRSPGQVNEEIRVREAILSYPWPDPDRPRLAACARHLSALYVLVDRLDYARRSATKALLLDPKPSSAKRLIAVRSPNARALLWPGEETLSYQGLDRLIFFR